MRQQFLDARALGVPTTDMRPARIKQPRCWKGLQSSADWCRAAGVLANILRQHLTCPALQSQANTPLASIFFGGGPGAIGQLVIRDGGDAPREMREKPARCSSVHIGYGTRHIRRLVSASRPNNEKGPCIAARPCFHSAFYGSPTWARTRDLRINSRATACFLGLPGIYWDG